MELGIFSRTYETGDLEETCRRMAAHGLLHAQFNFSNAGLATLPAVLRDEDLERIQTVTAAHGIALDALTGTFNMIDRDADARRRGCEQFAVQCRGARDLGIPIVSLCTGSKHPSDKWCWHDDNLTEAAWSDLLRSTEAVLKEAETWGVTLGVETEASNIVNTPQRARRYLDTFQSPRLKIIMDGANLFRPEQLENMTAVLEEAFALLGRDIVLAHAKDLRRDMTFVAAGQGDLDFPLYIRLLAESGYRGPLVIHGLLEEQVPASKAFLEELL